MFEISAVGIEALNWKFDSMPQRLRAAFAAKARQLADALVRKVRDEKLSGQMLGERTGRLKDSIDSSVEENAGGVTASVFVAGDVPYAAIQEYGGRTKAHVIEAANAKSLAFLFDGKQAFFVRVNHPGSDIPERSYLGSSLDEMQDEITQGYADALADGTE